MTQKDSVQEAAKYCLLLDCSFVNVQSQIGDHHVLLPIHPEEFLSIDCRGNR